MVENISTRSLINKGCVIYPIYFNINSSCKFRKIPKSYCVSNPDIKIISNLILKLGLKSTIQSQNTHPSDFFNHGRILVEFIDENGKNLSNDVTTRKALYKSISKNLKIESKVKSKPTKKKNKK